MIAGLDWDRVYPLAGPVAVEGAEPGDTLVVEILDIHTKGWGWTAILPGLGLLADDFTEPYLRIFDLSPGDHTYFREDIVIPLTPFMGTMGVCPARRARAADDAARHASAATWTPASSSPARPCTCRCTSRARCSAPATRTAARATARSA